MVSNSANHEFPGFKFAETPSLIDHHAPGLEEANKEVAQPPGFE